MKLYDIFHQFDIDEKYDAEILPYGSGHINDTYVCGKYILQRINTSVFKKPHELMSNIELVTSHLKRKILNDGGNPDRETLTVIKTKDGKSFFTSSDGNAYRLYLFIDAVSFDKSASDEMVYKEAAAFGLFQKRLADFDPSRLFEVIPDFHNTEKRYEAFLSAVENDAFGRANGVRDKIDFFMSRREYASRVVSMLRDGKLPIRVTHNDTKLNNVLFDREGKNAVSVIDLDTVMPGSVIYDFGDAIRICACTAKEDERDLSVVHFDISKYRAFAEGFISEVKTTLDKAEIDLLPFSAILLTYECGMRFLTDYLCGDTYFKIAREGHNLDRCATQMKMVTEMENMLPLMEKIIGEII